MGKNRKYSEQQYLLRIYIQIARDRTHKSTNGKLALYHLPDLYCYQVEDKPPVMYSTFSLLFYLPLGVEVGYLGLVNL